MDLSGVECKFQEKLKSYFPNKKEYVLECSERSASLKFLNYRISVDLSPKENMLMFLFRKGIEIVESLHKRLKETASVRSQKKRQSFIEFCKRENKNREQTSEVNKKVDFVKEEHEPYKKFKSAAMCEIPATLTQKACNKNSIRDGVDNTEIGIVESIKNSRGLMQIRDASKILAKEEKRKIFKDQDTSFIDFNACNSSVIGTNREFIEFGQNTSMENATFLSNTSASLDLPGVSNPHIKNASLDLNSIDQAGNVHAVKNELWDRTDETNNTPLQSATAYTTGSFFKSLKPKEKNIPNSSNIIFPNSLHPTIENTTALDTSTICYDSARTDAASSSFVAANSVGLETGLIPDTNFLKKLITEYKNTERGGIQIVRSFCSKYKIAPPEFEIVRENDVYRCTAVFSDINFVSSYEYDKLDAKDEACKKILDYIVRNWEDVFTQEHCLFNK